MDEQILNLTLLSALRTGNVILDLLVAALIPAVCWSLWGKLKFYWRELVRHGRNIYDRNGGSYRRHIAHTKSTPFDDEVDACANHVLQNAIRTYIGSQLPTANLRGTMRLTHLKSTNKPSNGNDSDEDGNDTVDGTEVTKNVFESGSLKVLLLPNTQQAPVEIVPGLFFSERFSMEEPPEDKEGRNKTRHSELVYTLMSNGHKGRTGKQVVDAFLKTVIEWYTAEVAKLEDDSRWMYQPLVTSSGSDRLYKRYKLSSEKTFNSLFFSEKERVVRVLDAFANKTGKYKIKGFPHRLSILLHGPPGTGKTSLVKAIALHTNRHVVSVPLSRMKTNQEFIDVMMDCVFKYCVPAGSSGNNGNDDNEAGEDGGTKRAQLSYENIVFLLEDVDAASTVVHRKTNPTGASAEREKQPPRRSEPVSPTTAKHDEEEGAPATSAAGDESAPLMDREATSAYTALDVVDGTSTPLPEDLASNASAPNTPQTTNPSAGENAAQAPTNNSNAKDSSSSDSDSDSEANARRRRRRRREEEANATEHLANLCQMLIQQKGSDNKKSTFGLADFDIKADALSLESILTVLDGVIDTPGRILVMTTNHPERLDPSLIRNGRINMKLYMGHLTSSQVQHMAAHYYPAASKDGIDRAVAAFRALISADSTGLVEGVLHTTTAARISPAEFEQLCAECDTVEDLAARLKEMALVPFGEPSATAPCPPIAV